jgi:hypothetical protein
MQTKYTKASIKSVVEVLSCEHVVHGLCGFFDKERCYSTVHIALCILGMLFGYSKLSHIYKCLRTIMPAVRGFVAIFPKMHEDSQYIIIKIPLVPPKRTSQEP